MNPEYLATKKIEQARAEKKWLMWAGDSSVIFSPDELEKKQAKGEFCHGDQNFSLFDPVPMLSGIDRHIEELRKDQALLRKRMGLPLETSSETAPIHLVFMAEFDVMENDAQHALRHALIGYTHSKKEADDAIEALKSKYEGKFYLGMDQQTYPQWHSKEVKLIAKVG